MAALSESRASATDTRADSLIVRWVAALGCSSSGLILLGKVYGLAPMHVTVLTFMTPLLLIVGAIWVWSVRERSQYTAPALLLGQVGGFLGTIGYDVARIPFLLMGQRVFAPISAYGVWLCDASSSSAVTEWTGWLYHFSNGMTFGMMYALVARRRHWGWAIAWAMLLETIALVCPLGQIFAITGNYKAMGIAYLGHLAYGLPLGWIVWRWDAAVAWTNSAGRLLRWSTAISVVTILAGISSAMIDAPAATSPPRWQVVDGRLTPDWLRIDYGMHVAVHNDAKKTVRIAVSDGREPVEVSPGGIRNLPFARPGIYRVHLETPGSTRSSFVIVEPADISSGN